ncbi:MAG: endonuclease MutS2 [bacterium]|nr:endonuclease MutS2 [bacterium]
MSIIQKSQKALEYDKILKELSAFAKTEQSKKLCMELTPFVKTEDINRELSLTRESKSVLDNAKDIPIEKIVNFTALKLKHEYFTEEELIDITKSIRTFRLVKNFIRENLTYETCLAGLADKLYSNKELEDKIFDTFDENCIVKKTATKELAGLYASLRDTEILLKEKIQELMNSSEFQSHLQENIYTIREDRIVFQVKASDKSKVSGIVHDVSATNKTFYIEPSQIIPMNNKIRELKSKIYAEVISILTDLSNCIKKELQLLIYSEGLLANIDLIFAKARYAVKIQAVEPTVNPEKFIRIDLMRHPLLIGRIDNIVENDFSIGGGYNSVIITGSNTGGKTVTLKTVGLFILMMKSGMFLPCAEAIIYPYENVLADIGDEQSILQSLSTFSSHMKNIISILKLSDKDSFVLIDELCAGTDPQEGAILAEVILKALKKKNVASVITTHYGELKALEYTDSYFKNASVEFNTETLKPTYKLIIGIPGLSNAILISSNLGLDENLVWEAKELLITQRDNSSIAVEKLHDTQVKLDDNLKNAQEINAQAEELKKHYEKELLQLKKDKKKSLKILKDRFEGQMETAKEEIKAILKELREEKSEKIARRSYERLSKLENGFRNDIIAQDEADTYEELDWDKIKLNDTVMIKELNQQVKILSLPDKNNSLIIQMGMIKTKINKNRLAVFNQNLAKKITLPKYPEASFKLRRYDISNTLDLRGERVEEALDKLEAYLDKASLANLTPVYIIHGHGTGALKSAVRDFVSTSPYVAKYRIGEDAEGGDGVCVIDIK